MLRTLFITFLLLIICGAAAVGLHLGYQRGFQKALQLQSGTFVGTLDALEKLRKGDINEGTKRVEALCFSSANIVYGDPNFKEGFAGGFVAKTFVGELKTYRQTYRTNNAEWTPMERGLERHLAEFKRK